MAEEGEGRVLGLHQVFPDPTDAIETAKTTADVVAIHGLDTHSPKTWVCYKIEGQPDSGEVHWLKDADMLPKFLPKCRIFTYDWNANIVKNSATQSLHGHADKLLDKLRIKRDEDTNRPILFIASCFGGLLLAEALLSASEVFNEFEDIYNSTIGAIFLGTPFQGTEKNFLSATRLRVLVAMQDGSETTRELLAYLQREPEREGDLDKLVRRFCLMINRENHTIPVDCFYETRWTDLSKIIESLPGELVDKLEVKRTGILVSQHSASLPGHTSRELSVRHGLMNKFRGPHDDAFETIRSALQRLLKKGENKLRQREILSSLKRDPTGLLISDWLKTCALSKSDPDVEALIWKARFLENLRDIPEQSLGSALRQLSPKNFGNIQQSLNSLALAVNSCRRTAADAESIRQGWSKSALSELGAKASADIERRTMEVCEAVQDGILLDPTIDLDHALHDNVAEVTGATPLIELRQQVLEVSDISGIREFPRSSVDFGTVVRPTLEPEHFRFGIVAGRQVLVESFAYKPVKGSVDASPDTLEKVKRMVAQLSYPRRTSLHVLPCIGYMKSQHSKQFGIVFDVGKNADSVQAVLPLRNLYGKQDRGSLGLRLRLAHSLATAMDGLHRVGWVHKEFNSMNLVFLTPKGGGGDPEDMGAEITQSSMLGPYLFGFECARPEDADTDLRVDFTHRKNAYRHPERWGRPMSKFNKTHDIYSLGVVLLELLLWKPIADAKFMKSNNGAEDPDDIKEAMLDFVNKNAPHMGGEAFANVIKTCLTFDKIGSGWDELSARRAFKTKVVDILRNLVDAQI